MSVEERLDKLETQHKNLDTDVHSLAKVCADIKNIALTNQHDIAGLKLDMADVKSDIADVKSDMANVKSDMANVKSDMADVKNDVADVKSDVDNVKACVAALAEATHAGFMRTDKRFDDMDAKFTERMDQMDAKFTERFEQLELLIRQSALTN